MQHATNRIPFRPALKCLLPLALIVVLAGCDTPINAVRAKRFGDNRIPQAAQAQPSAVALAMQVTPDGQGLTPESMRQANALLTRQGRIEDQVITLTPFNADGAAVAQRVAQALGRAGAREPRVMPLPRDAERMAEAADAGWDLELQSESLALDLAHCGLARPHQVTVHPYYGVGQLGCANRANLARMTTDPRDLSRPRTLEGADGKAAAGAVERYQTGEIRDLIDIDFDN